jgi:hypothetical protein
MSSRIVKHKDMLKVLATAPNSMRRSIIKEASPGLINCISECCYNILKGNVSLTTPQKRRLAGQKHKLRQLARKGTSVAQRKRVIQSGGFLPFLPLLAKIATGIIPGLLGI